MAAYLDRPARRQVKPKRSDVKTMNEEGGEYNIWYNRYQGEMKRWDVLEKAEHRCNIARDAGKTNSRPGAFFCIHFVRGKCSKGAECHYLHRVPNDSDSFPLTYDCFGREKYRNEREDKSGTGSFEKDNRCLYVGPCFTDDKSQDCVTRHFSEWGELESVKFISSKSVAFVRLKLRANAEFAKEAMMGQSLDNAEILDIRWAVDDPSIDVQADYKRKYEEIIAKSVAKKLPILGDRGTYLDYDEYAYNQQEEDLPDQKKAKVGSNEEYRKYYEDCSKSYRDIGDHATAATYAQYSLHYAKLVENGKGDALAATEDAVEQGQRSEVKQKVANASFALIEDYGSEED